MLKLTDKELKLFALALAPEAFNGERDMAAAKLFSSLRNRGVVIEDLGAPQQRPAMIPVWRYWNVTFGSTVTTSSY